MDGQAACLGGWKARSNPGQELAGTFRAVLLPASGRGAELLRPLHRRSWVCRADRRHEAAYRSTGEPFRLSRLHRAVATVGCPVGPASGDRAGPRLFLRARRMDRGRFHPPRRSTLAGRGQPAVCRVDRGPGAGEATLAPGGTSEGVCTASPARTSRRTPQMGPHTVVGKAILYARRSFVAPEIPVCDTASRDLFAIPEVADVPWPGTRIAVGEPVMSLLTSGPDVPTCEAQLRSLEEHWQRRLRSGPRQA